MNDNFNIDFEAELRKYGIEITQPTDKGEKTDANPFPISAFPFEVQNIINATKDNLNFPIDFIGVSMLSAASIAIGNTRRVELKRGFQESPVLYIAIVAPPGTNKTHPLYFAMSPIMNVDKELYKRYNLDRREYDRLKEMSGSEREKSGVKINTKPTLKKHLISDFTPEALAQIHNANIRGIGVYADELAGWIKNFNRYNKGSEMEFWLSAWNSKPIAIDRKGGEPISIHFPFIPVVGTIQNGLLNELAKDGRRLNGFIDRILFSIPENIQKPYWNDNEIDQKYIDAWEKIINLILNTPLNEDEHSNPRPEILKFNQAAKQLLLKWQKENTDKCNREPNETLKGVYSKLEIYVIRLSLILEVFFWACNESGIQEISVRSVQGAISLINYFEKSAVKVNSIVANINPLKNLNMEEQNLYDALPKSFSTKEGLDVAESLDVAERTFKRFLTNERLFLKISHGHYEKILSQT